MGYSPTVQGQETCWGPTRSLEVVMKGKIPAPDGNQTPVIHLTVTLLAEITRITLQFGVYSDSASSLLYG